MAHGSLSTDESLDSALRERLRNALESDCVTEAELRTIAEQGRACTLILRGLIGASRTRLDHLTADPSSSLADVAAAYRAVSDLQPHLDELEALLTALDTRSHELRAHWLGASVSRSEGSPARPPDLP